MKTLKEALSNEITREEFFSKECELYGRTEVEPTTLRKIHLEAGEQRLWLTTDSGTICLVGEGDCCSETWFADLIGVETALGSVVRWVEHVDMPSPDDERSRQEVDEAYGIRLGTDGGELLIAYRNSSNGYYGGSHEVCDGKPGPNEREITEDFSA